MSKTFPRLKPFGPGGRCISPFTLFEQVPTVETENLTYIEFLLGVLNQVNNLINYYNEVAETVEEYGKIIEDFPDQIKELQEAVTTLQTWVGNQIINLTQMITEGDANTLEQAKKYTDNAIIKNGGGICTLGGLTAEEYDAMQLEAVDYDDIEIKAKDYDGKARIIFFGDVSTIYLQYKSSFTANALETIFDLANPPVKPGRRYQVEVSLGNFSLDGNEPAHLEIVGANSLGATLPITVPSGGWSSVVGIFNTPPTAIRLMSGENSVTGYNAYVKIKPLGEI